MAKLFNLTWVFMLLAVLAVGGGTAVLPEMEHMTVDHFRWITEGQFRDIYSIGQVAPGPNMLMVLLIGYRMAGALGALVVGIAFFVPDCVLTLVVNRLWEHLQDSPWRAAVQHGMAPVAVGLMVSGTYSIARLSIFNLTSLLIAVTIFALLLWRHINPALLVLGGGIVYLLLPHAVHLFPRH